MKRETRRNKDPMGYFKQTTHKQTTQQTNRTSNRPVSLSMTHLLGISPPDFWQTRRWTGDKENRNLCGNKAERIYDRLEIIRLTNHLSRLLFSPSLSPGHGDGERFLLLRLLFPTTHTHTSEKCSSPTLL